MNQQILLKILISSTFFKLAVAPLAAIYWVTIRLRVFLYHQNIFKKHTLPGKTISVGNIELGGTGKSPTVHAICELLISMGHTPAILARGYKSGLNAQDSMTLLGEQIILPPAVPGHYHPDEARMLAAQLQTVAVIVGRDRFSAAQRYLSKFPPPSHWILDDGFQHLKINRDLDIVLLDAESPLGNGWVLPMGRLREDSSALKRADIIFIAKKTPLATTAQLPDFCTLYFDLNFTNDPPIQMCGSPQDYNKLKNIAVVTAIAKPKTLLEYPEKQRQILISKLIKSDHQKINTDELISVATPAEAILTTAKDYYRDPEVFSNIAIPVYILPLKVTLPRDKITHFLS